MKARRHALVALLLLAGLSLPAWAEQQKAAAKKPLRLEDIFVEGGLTGRLPTQMRWSPDGRLLSYILQADEGDPSASLGAGRRDLWVVDAESGEKRVLVSYEQLVRLAPSPEQATQDERERERLLRYAVAAYVWSPDSKAILFASAGQLYLFELATGQARVLAPSKRDMGDPKFSPDGKWVSFVYEHDLWLVPTAGGEEKQLTLGGNENVLHGDLDWVYPEEFNVRTGYHWSPDSRRIAFLEMDEHPVPTYPISDLVPREAQVDWQRYPKAGDPNPKVRVGIVDIEAASRGGASETQVVWLDRAAHYIPRFTWVDANRLAVQLLNRAQTELELILADAATGRSHSVFSDSDPYWINVTDDLRFLPPGEFLWTSEGTGFRHIYLHRLDAGSKPVPYRIEGSLKRALTAGEWEVGGIEGVDPAGGWVYFTSTERNPLGHDLYRVKLGGSGRELVTQARGTHSLVMSSTATAYVDTHSALGRVPEITVHHLPSGRSTVVHKARSVDEYEMVAPERVELRAPDGALVRGLLLKPKEAEAPGKARQAAPRKYPAVMHVYGGPHAPTIRDAWGANRYLFHQFLVQQGFVVLYVDDRASSLLGHKYEAALHRRYGPTALADQRVAVEYLRRLPFVDPERIAIWGWSGGGFSTCFALTHSDLFKVGIAVAPVTDWHLYDSIYTERYMGLPASAPRPAQGNSQEQSDPYLATSCVEAAKDLKGRLLLVHGLADDNVHLQNSEQFIHALIEAGKLFDLLVYPRKTHSIAGAKTQLHLFRSLTEYLKKHL